MSDLEHPVFTALARAIVSLPTDTDPVELVAGVSAFVAHLSRSLCETNRLDDVLSVVMMFANGALAGAREAHSVQIPSEPHVVSLTVH